MIGLKFYDNKKYYDFIEGRDSSPMVEILDKQNFTMWLCSSLLTDQETVDEKDTKKQFVRLSDRLKETYDAIFNFNYDNGVYEKPIGKLEFSQGTKQMLLQTVSLLSDFAQYND